MTRHARIRVNVRSRTGWDRAGRAADAISTATHVVYVAVMFTGLIAALITYWADLGPVGQTTTAAARRTAGRTRHAPTAEQQAVIDACHTGGGLVVEAAAGAGKTSTLRLASERMRGRVLYVAYNKAAATEAQRSFPSHVRCSTVHALAFAAVGRTYADRLRAPRQSARETATRLGLTSPVDIGATLSLTPVHLARFAASTVDTWCQSADLTLGEEHVPPIPGMPSRADLRKLRADLARAETAGSAEAADLRSVVGEVDKARADLVTTVLPVARRMWADLRDPAGHLVRFQHDHYLKMWQLSGPRLPFDVVMLDEAQDSNPVTADVITSQQAQRIAIGDACQQLYGWRGAVDALATWPAEQRLFLTRSWRFGPAVADEANKWLTLLDADLRVDGNPALDTVVGPMVRPDAVLCRTNAGAIARVITELDAGRRPALVGGAGELIRLTEAADELQSGRRTGHPELFVFTTWRQVQEYAEDPSGADLRVFVKRVDQHGANALLAALRRTVDEDRADLTVSTAHRSKGREWPAVQIADDFTEPVDDAGKPKPIPRADAMLAYVAVTRAKLALDRGSLAYVDNRLAPAVAR